MKPTIAKIIPITIVSKEIVLKDNWQIYEYSMIPFILGDKPTVKGKEVFKLSKQMMKGNKWRLFVIDLSFIGWEILSIFTLGLLNIFYVNPYKVATKTELYEVLKENAIQNKFEYYEDLK